MIDRSFLHLPGERFLCVETPSELTKKLRCFWQGFLREKTHRDRTFSIRRVGGKFIWIRENKSNLSLSADSILLRLEKEILEDAVAHIPEDYLVLHAAGLRFGGTVYVFYGGPGSGKTTIIDQLLSTGGKFISDELIIVDPARQTIEPFPRPLSYEATFPPGQAETRIKFHDGETLFHYGLPRADSICRKLFEWNRVHFYKLRRGETSLNIQPQSTGQGLIQLLPHLFQPEASRNRFRKLALLGDHEQDLRFSRLEYNEASTASQKLLSRGSSS